MKKNPKRIFAIVEKTTAIDMTPIYTFTFVDKVKKGTVLRFDAAESVLKEEPEIESSNT